MLKISNLARPVDIQETVGLFGRHYIFSSPGPSILVTGALHGDEVTSTSALWQLASRLEQEPLTGRITLIPCVNQMAVKASSRLVPLEGSDLNRVFPGRPDGSLAERLAYALIDLLGEHDALLDVHTAGWCTSFVLVDEIGEEGLKNIIHAWAAESGMPVIGEMPAEHLHLQSLDRSFSAWAAIQLRKPALTLELPGFHTIEREGAAQGCDALLRLLRSYSTLSVTGEHRGPALSRLELYADAGGLFETLISPGVHVDPDTRIGHVRSHEGEILQTIRAGKAGLLIALQPISAVHVGSWLATLAIEISRTS